MFGCSRKRRGFTLVELLIVIIIIGILAGMMMLAAGSATDKAEATKVVSNLKQLKSAALLRYSEAGSWNAVLNTYTADDTGGFQYEALAQDLMGNELGTASDSIAYSVRPYGSGVVVKCELSSLYPDSSRRKAIEKALISLANKGVPLLAGPNYVKYDASQADGVLHSVSMYVVRN